MNNKDTVVVPREVKIEDALRECRISFLEAVDELGQGSLARWFLSKVKMCDAALAAAPSTSVREEDARVAALVGEIEAGRFDALEVGADQWIESAGVKRMANAIASVFEKHAPQDIMDRFRQKIVALMHLAFVEGAAQGVLQLRDPAALKPSTDKGDVG